MSREAEPLSYEPFGRTRHAFPRRHVIRGAALLLLGLMAMGFFAAVIIPHASFLSAQRAVYRRAEPGEAPFIVIRHAASGDRYIRTIAPGSVEGSLDALRRYLLAATSLGYQERINSVAVPIEVAGEEMLVVLVFSEAADSLQLLHIGRLPSFNFWQRPPVRGRVLVALDWPHPLQPGLGSPPLQLSHLTYDAQSDRPVRFIATSGEAVFRCTLGLDGSVGFVEMSRD